MAVPSSVTDNFDALFTTSLRNAKKSLEDQISTSNALLFKIMKMNKTYKSEASLGYQIQIPLMYELSQADSYDGYDTLQVDPIDGITSALYDWRQMSVPVVISGKELKINKGENQLINLMTAKIDQAKLGIQDLFGKAMIRGNGVNGGNLHAPYASPNNGSLFIDPILKLIRMDPTASEVIGNINQNTYTWWRNQFTDSAATTFVGWRKELRTLYNNCGKGPGGFPDLHITDQTTFELWEAALESFHQNPSYVKADLPFETIQFRGNAVTWDEFVPDAKNNTVAVTEGTWLMINTKYWTIKYEAETNFDSTPFQKPVNQDAKVSHIMWMGGACTSNRRKQGVMGDILLSIAS